MSSKIQPFKNYEEIFQNNYNKTPFEFNSDFVNSFQNKALGFLHNHHLKNNYSYKNFINTIKHNFQNKNEYAISARSFKDLDLLSLPAEKIFKILTSSGTSGTVPSKIYLDKLTAKYQSKVLSSLLSSFTDGKRLPMLVIDSKSILKDKKSFSARGAGIIGFSTIATRQYYALDEEYELDMQKLNDFIEKFGDEPFLIFGFTFMIYEKLILETSKLKFKNIFKNGIMFHGGGWKKLISLDISNEKYKSDLYKKYGLSRVHNYYGMVEQTGSIFLECSHGFLHSSIYSNVSIVDSSLHELPYGQKGMIKLTSVLPYSYPGHSLLTEDVGICYGVDNCKCGLKGKYFKVLGRAKKAEIRGCSDVYQ